MACDNVCAIVTNDLLYDCSNKAVGGVVQTIKLINKCDIDISEWTVNNGTVEACAHTIAYDGTDPSELEAVTVQGIPGKRLLNATFTSSDTYFGTYFTHTVDLFGQGLTEQALCNIKAFANGAEVVAIIEQNFKGEDGESAFLVYGWDTGLKLGDMTHDFNENNGNAVIPLTSRDPDLEPQPPYVLLMTDYETTKAFFDSLGSGG